MAQALVCSKCGSTWFRSEERVKIDAGQRQSRSGSVGVLDRWVVIRCSACGQAYDEDEGGYLKPVPVDGKRRTLQTEIADWQRETFPNTSLLTHLAKTDAELKELREVLYKIAIWDAVGDGGPVPDELAERLRDEVADAVIVLMHVGTLNGFDVLSVAAEKMIRNKLRNWDRQDDGTYQHEDEGYPDWLRAGQRVQVNPDLAYALQKGWIMAVEPDGLAIVVLDRGDLITMAPFNLTPIYMRETT